jgi:hypothetical protein
MMKPDLTMHDLEEIWHKGSKATFEGLVEEVRTEGAR